MAEKVEKPVFARLLTKLLLLVAPACRITLLLWFFAIGLGRPESKAVTNTFEFQNSIPKIGSIQWQIDQHNIKKEQELHRKRLIIPDAVGTNVLRASTAYLINGQKIEASPTFVPAPISASMSAHGILLKIIILVVVFITAEILMIRKFVPQFITEIRQLFNPWAPYENIERTPLTKVRAEEMAFGEFLAEFRRDSFDVPQISTPERNNLLNGFYERTKKSLVLQRKLLLEINQETNDAVRHKMLTNVYSDINKLKGEAGFPEVLLIWQVTSALEGLLRQLTEKIRNVTPSTLRTIGGSLGLLEDLCVPGLKFDSISNRPLKFLVVDDDLISRQALRLALSKAFSQPDMVADSKSALAQTGKLTYDVIFLDVQMPEMDGFELCTKIRDADFNRHTPVVFVTGQNDFDARAKSTLSGGNDLMGKPFLMFEVTVKALTLALQNRLQNGAQKLLSKLERKISTNTASAAGTIPSLPITRSLASNQTLPPEEMDEMTMAFLVRVTKNVNPLRELCRSMLAASNEEVRQTILVDGFLRINSFLSQSDAEILHPAYQMSSALEGLFRKLMENSKLSTPSILATIAAGVELLNDLCSPEVRIDLALDPPIQMLVVDDDLVARRVLVGALQTTFKKPESVENGEAALLLADKEIFDVVFLDIQMPGMDGFETCAKIRETAANRTTPIVFVTAHIDYEMRRAQMVQNGGDDLIGKPFPVSEITVKALAFALRGRLRASKNG